MIHKINIRTIVFLALTGILILLNMLALLQIIPIFITLPLLFLTTYCTFHSFYYRHYFKGK